MIEFMDFSRVLPRLFRRVFRQKVCNHSDDLLPQIALLLDVSAASDGAHGGNVCNRPTDNCSACADQSREDLVAHKRLRSAESGAKYHYASGKSNTLLMGLLGVRRTHCGSLQNDGRTVSPRRSCECRMVM